METVVTLLSFPNDSGPIYQETIACRFPVEPFNTFSNVFFLILAIYFGQKIYPDYKDHKFLALSIPVLIIGFIGGTVYHATRSHEIWLIMDWLPILLLCLAVSVYFIVKSTHGIWQRLISAIIVLTLVFGVRYLPFGRYQESMNYVGTALGLLLPIINYLFKTDFHHFLQILFALLSFSVAVSFRAMDKHMDDLEMGTHWLWHTFGALSVYFLMEFIYRTQESSVKGVKSEK
ncbi:ceramidase domain-containing protein [Autumnicola psychrophila]|uniref:Ceramidase domain-containing protein n=1 Tax=Autumnicola psychrophila TaxID=3075592 RepID=A0ABU3DNK0_9FLAO|nr:ceramidase domain-containing protein [Zunongwangia sp. F225]MDT0685298.1 ceramidase domain-containing protein [Zunongwangia sp. F225]